MPLTSVFGKRPCHESKTQPMTNVREGAYAMIWIPSPNFDPGHQGYDMSKGFIIVHGTATPGYSAQDTARDFQNPAKKVSAHYVIGRDGTVVQCVDEANSAWANGIITGTPGI